MYTEFACWWPLISPPQDYADESHFYREKLVSACKIQPSTMLELGCGGGNNASHLKKFFDMTLVDLSPDMLAVSQELNPECEHLLGDMRSLRLGRTFDTVFIHDAVVYMTSEHDLAMAIETAYLHCNTAGAALFAPDDVSETFKASTSHGGGDDGARSVRYLEWVQPLSNGDNRYRVDYAYLLQEGNNPLRVESDHHVCGLFSCQTWLRLLRQAGFETEQHTDIHGCKVFIGKKGYTHEY